MNEYVERIDPKSGEVVVAPIEPRELLHSESSRGQCFRFKGHGVPAAQAARIADELRGQGAAALARATENGRLGLSVLVTGGSGFLGKEILAQAARDAEIARLIVLMRPKPVIDKRSGRVIEVLSPERRGEALLAELRLTTEQRGKFRFVAGDVEQEGLGIAAGVAEALRGDITHVIHSAANVAFDDTYERSFRANVVAARNALQFSRWLQQASNGRFVAHLAVGTSYVHGRCGAEPVGEDSLAFPADGYNNYYELTKAMAALAAERHVLHHGLRAVELCPAIVIGDQRTGNNRGDTKVINAPVNFLGRTREWLEDRARGALWQRALASLAASVAMRLPADPDAAMNLVTVDWVARGVLAALKKPQAIARRIHLASGARPSAQALAALLSEEMAVSVRLLSPSVHRKLMLPLACAMLKLVGQEKCARRLHRLGTVFAGYSDDRQPVHAVANDVAILGLPAERPSMVEALRMLCRHNEWVQEFGRIRDAEQLTRRESLWAELIERIEQRAARPAAQIPPLEFREQLAALTGAPLPSRASRGFAVETAIA